MYCYRTGDSVTKVTVFYKSQPGLTFIGGDEISALFVKEDGDHTVNIMVGSPWTAAKTGKANVDTVSRS
jgi:hypothetical protein